MEIKMPINCPKCNKFVGFNRKFNKYICSYCGWQSDELFKGNEDYLDDFIQQLWRYISLNNSDVCKDLKQSLIKLLNSL
jgi:transposase-like protein